MPVLESDRGHARRARARLLIQLPGQVLALLLSHLDAQAAGLTPDHRLSCRPTYPSLSPAMLIRLHASRAHEASSKPCSPNNDDNDPDTIPGSYSLGAAQPSHNLVRAQGFTSRPRWRESPAHRALPPNNLRSPARPSWPPAPGDSASRSSMSVPVCQLHERRDR